MVTRKRRYDDFCAAAHALDIVGERWALLIVRELVLGPRRFSDLRTQLGSISANVLTQRLNELEAAGVLKRTHLPAPASTWAYALTSWGKELEVVLLQLARWGVRSAAFTRGQPISPDAFMLSLKAMFRPEADVRQAAMGDTPLRIALVVSDQPYCAVISQGVLELSRTECTDQADAVIHGDTPALLGLAYGGADLDHAATSGTVRCSGDTGAVRRFFSMFELPEPTQPPG